MAVIKIYILHHLKFSLIGDGLLSNKTSILIIRGSIFTGGD